MRPKKSEPQPPSPSGKGAPGTRTAPPLARLETKEEKAANTIKQCSRSLGKFIEFAESRGTGGEINKKVLIDYKNAMLEEMERNRSDPKPGLAVRLLRDETGNTLDDMLTESEYRRILEWAGRLGKERAGLIMETLAGTGIRISELKCITVESLRRGTAVATSKGKTRTIFIPKALARKLKSYRAPHQADHQGAATGRRRPGGLLRAAQSHREGKWRTKAERTQENEENRKQNMINHKFCFGAPGHRKTTGFIKGYSKRKKGCGINRRGRWHPTKQGRNFDYIRPVFQNPKTAKNLLAVSR